MFPASRPCAPSGDRVRPGDRSGGTCVRALQGRRPRRPRSGDRRATRRWFWWRTHG